LSTELSGEVTGSIFSKPTFGTSLPKIDSRPICQPRTNVAADFRALCARRVAQSMLLETYGERASIFLEWLGQIFGYFHQHVAELQIAFVVE